MSCNHDCKTCNQSNCNDRKESLLFKPNNDSKIKKIIGIVSGKGGVGKSLVTSLLASKMAREGYKVGILDADITGPSIPFAFGIHEKLYGTVENKMIPAISKTGIKIVSVNLLIENETDPVLWRGPILGGAIKQFYEDTLWGDIDYLFVDMPPGTSDVALTVFNSLPLDGVIIVSSPQDLVSMIVGKALTMADKMNIKVIGLVENMAYLKCPHCDEIIYPYGESKLNEVANKYHILPLASLPIDANMRQLVDNGLVEDVMIDDLDNCISEIKEI